MHLRTSIRNAVADRLRDGVSICGGRVFRYRTTPWDDQDLPCLIVHLGSESPTDIGNGQHPKVYERSLEVVVRGIVANGQTIEDDVDTLLEQVETAIVSDDLSFGGIVEDITFVGVSDTTNRAGEVELPFGVFNAVWKVTYRTRDGNPSQTASAVTPTAATTFI